MNILFSKQLSQRQPLAARLFQTAVNSNKLAKAYMLAGHATDDKWELSTQLAAHLNCEKAKAGQANSCLIGETVEREWCTNCRWIKTDKHPQALVKLSGSNTKSGKIAVEQARAFSEEISKTSSYFRVMVIEDAKQEILHPPAANALLKTVEEPRSKVLMIFFAQASSEVLPTILSRCQVVNTISSQYKECLSLSSLKSFDPFISTKYPDVTKLDAIANSLRRFTSQDSNLVDAISFAETIQLLVKEGLELDALLDYLVIKDLLGIESIFTEEKVLRYTRELFLLNQIAKEQSKHYVSEKALVETFVFAWHKLKQTGINPLKLQR